MALLNYSNSELINKNTLIQYLTDKDGIQKPLTAFFIDEDGEIAGLPIIVELKNLHQFIDYFKGAYIGFAVGFIRLFEISDGILCYVNSDVPIKRSDVRFILYNCGLIDIN